MAKDTINNPFVMPCYRVPVTMYPPIDFIKLNELLHVGHLCYYNKNISTTPACNK